MSEDSDIVQSPLLTVQWVFIVSQVRDLRMHLFNDLEKRFQIFQTVPYCSQVESCI